MAINKKKTTDYKHLDVSLVRSVERDDVAGSKPYVLFSVSSGGNTREELMDMTKEAFARAKKGTGCRSKELRNGLCGVSRFEFVAFYSEPDKEAGETRPVAQGIHCVPNDNYLEADFAVELRNADIERDNAVVDIHPTTGEIDIVAFPFVFRKQKYRFLQHLEDLDSIDEFTSFRLGDLEYDVQDTSGSRVIFICRNMNPDASLQGRR